MLFKADTLRRIRSGEITVAIRTWKRPTVTAGGTLQTAAGLLSIDSVEQIDERDLTEGDAIAAGFDTVEQVMSSLRLGPDRDLHRVRFHRISDDPRIDLRNQRELSDGDAAEITDQCRRWDAASKSGPWTAGVLAVIGAHPGERSLDLMDHLDRAGAPPVAQPVFKRRVRQLKGLGLTESLGTGYRLAPRGVAYMARNAG